MRDGISRKIGKRPHGEEHEPDEKESSEGQNAINHFSLGNQVHEIAGHQRRFTDGDNECDGNVDFAVAKRDVRGAHGNERAK